MLCPVLYTQHGLSTMGQTLRGRICKPAPFDTTLLDAWCLWFTGMAPVSCSSLSSISADLLADLLNPNVLALIAQAKKQAHNEDMHT